MKTDVRIGNAFDLIKELEDKSVDCVMTSPPYWGLRNYETELIIFDDHGDCDHEWGDEIIRKTSDTYNEGFNERYGKSPGQKKQEQSSYGQLKQGMFCKKCGAWKGQLGLEPTPELFIKHLVNFFDDVKMKLKSEGNVFVNLGDTYFGSGTGHYSNPEAHGKMIQNAFLSASKAKDGILKNHVFLKSKSACMIPERFAWDMIEHGWILRNKIVWKKGNAMPSSVKDRLSNKYEFIYHFVKQKKYYYNLDAIRVSHKWMDTEGKRIGSDTIGQIAKQKRFSKGEYGDKFNENPNHESFGSLRARTQRSADYKGKWEEESEEFNQLSQYQQRVNDARADGAPHESTMNHPLGKNPGDFIVTDMDSLNENELRFELRNLIDQWQEMHPDDWDSGDIFTVNTKPYPKAHFATFNIKLIEKPILAGCPPKGTVLDPFGGSGTVAEFCRFNDRDSIIFELNPEYRELIVERAKLREKPLGDIFK